MRSFEQRVGSSGGETDYRPRVRPMAHISFVPEGELADLLVSHLMEGSSNDDNTLVLESARFNVDNLGTSEPYPPGSKLSIIGLRHSIEERGHAQTGELQIMRTRFLLLPPFKDRQALSRLVGRSDALASSALQFKLGMHQLGHELRNNEAHLDSEVSAIDSKLDRTMRYTPSSTMYQVRSLGISDVPLQ